MKAELAKVFALGIPERLQIVEDLWDSIAATPTQVPITDWQKAELARRKENFFKNSDSGVTWEAVRRKVHQRND